ncbi:hypothetical protein FB45DRAFT_183907 [Roridomyces roridus]|uniref:DUF6534 domain-containing protein n=1 Tax=Roridomyces roridus TaxID=1738132 RepID=A0AAD7CEW5_9AGAR|nr:hypothetical protein FB45DRAFT_183907 [Roridomyces roridus]
MSSGMDISSEADAMFVGVILAPVLCGITISQSWTYFRSNRDGWIMQSLVALLFAMDVAETVLTSQMAHEYLIKNFGNVEALSRLPVSSIVEVGMNAVLVFLVEVFFAHRVYRLTQKTLLPALIIFFGVAGLVAGIAIVVNITRGSLEVSALAFGSMKVEVCLSNGFEALSDLLATYALSREFLKNKGLALKSTDSLLDKLLGFTVARGGLVTFAQFLTLALYVANPTKLYWMPIHFVQGKLCVITMLVILNSRDSLRLVGRHPTFLNHSAFSESVVAWQLPQAGAGTIPQTFQLHSLDASLRHGQGDKSGNDSACPVLSFSLLLIRDLQARDRIQLHIPRGQSATVK